jgi:multicomponent K+:H+ antiporter subunit G
MTATLMNAADALIAALVVIGAAFALIGSWGLAKLSDFYLRLHGPTKASTLGVGCVPLVAMALAATGGGSTGLPLRELLITLFVFLTAPVAAHLLVKAALRVSMKQPPRTIELPPGER